MLTLSLARLGHAAPDEVPNSAPDFVLDRAAQVTLPLQQPLWSGPNDLSANVWLSREGAGETRALVLRIAVTDDNFVQPFKGGEAWQGDGIQVAFGAPGAKDWWEVGLSKWPEGNAAAHVFRAVPELPNPWREVQLTITPRPDGLLYQARFPFKAFALSDKLLELGLRFNLLVNDRDDAGEQGQRESYIALSRGIGDEKNAQLFPIIQFAAKDERVVITPPRSDPPPPAAYSITEQLTTQTVAGPSWAKTLPIYEANLEHYQAQPGQAFKGLEANLPRLKKMGVGIVWLMPIFPRGKLKAFGSPYSVRDYRAVNPDFGTPDEFRHLVATAHTIGMRIILDWVPLHLAWDNAWIEAHPDWYQKTANGEISQSGPWADVARFDYGTMEKPNQELWDAMRDALLFWVREYQVDGFRADVAAEVPTEFWQWLRPQLNAVRPVFMLAEAQEPALHPAFDMSYAWDMMSWAHDLARGKTNARDLDKVLRGEAESFPAGAIMMRFVVNHDTAGDHEKFPIAAGSARALSVLSATLPGKPMVYSGQEAGMTETGIGYGVKNIEWKDAATEEFYTTLFRLYRAHPALYEGDFFKVPTSNDDAIYAFVRRCPEEEGEDKALVIINLSDEAQTFTLGDAKTEKYAGKYLQAFGGAKISVTDGQKMTLPAWGYAVYTTPARRKVY